MDSCPPGQLTYAKQSKLSIIPGRQPIQLNGRRYCCAAAADVEAESKPSGRVELPKNFDPAASEEQMYQW